MVTNKDFSPVKNKAKFCQHRIIPFQKYIKISFDSVNIR